MVGLKRLWFAIKYEIFIVNVDIKHVFLSVVYILLSKYQEAKSKKISKCPFSEIFGKSLLLGPSSRYQRTQKY